LAAGLVHGALSDIGFRMPKSASTQAPPKLTQEQNNARSIDQSESPEKEMADQTPSDETSGESSSQNSSVSQTAESEDEFPVELLHEYWASGMATLLDARSAEEYEEAHIPMARHTPLSSFDMGVPQDILSKPTDHYFIVYCSGGDCHASHSVGSLLTEYGYTNVIIFEKGFQAWVEAGYEVESGS
jgi:rhodanese-related sulfurtransferase